MFQTFDDSADPTQAGERIARLRAELDRLGVDGFLVPRADEHQGEYVPECAERLRWLTGFSGSAGLAIVLRDSAVIFVDGRYTLQVRNQTDGRIFTYEDLIATPPAEWLRRNAPHGLRLGFDPWLHTIREAERLRAALAASNGQLIALDRNPVDAVWHDRPAPPRGEVSLHPVAYSGKPARQKLEELAAGLGEASHYILSDPASIAWAFNIRGKDVPHTPLALGYAILAADGSHALFMDEDKIGPEVRHELAGLCRLMRPDGLVAELARLARQGARIGMDPDIASEQLRMIAGEAAILLDDPVTLPRAVKNATEIEGARRAQRRDGIAVTRFLYWLHRQAPGTVDEIGAVRRLEECRRHAGEADGMPLEDISFDTISGAGPHGAIIHYRVTRSTNRILEPGTLYLFDSGGQYRDGTTDITRTVAIGTPTDAMRRHYTIVLKGLIALSTLRFPEGLRGCDIDAVARMAHWKAGIDYSHGTGHGVGSYLSVHEGPQRISRSGTTRLQPGMIVSNEPGYYREGEYGIRLENLVLVTGPAAIAGGDREMLGFETLTLVPFDRSLIDPALLTREERAWLEDYHARVLREIGPALDAEERAWLEGLANGA